MSNGSGGYTISGGKVYSGIDIHLFQITSIMHGKMVDLRLLQQFIYDDVGSVDGCK